MSSESKILTDLKLEILLVEDDYIDQKSFVKACQVLAPNYKIDCVDTISKAISQIESSNYGIVVTDYYLSDGTGIDLINKFPEMPMLFTTGSDETKIAVEAMKAGAKDFLTKDYSLDYLNIVPISIENVYLRHIESKRAIIAERSFRDLFENAHDLIQSLNMDGYFNFVNPAWENTLGYNNEEVKKMHFMQIVDPEYHNHCSTIFKQISSGQHLVGEEIKFISKSGKEVIVEGNISPTETETDGTTSSIAIFRNVTERKEVEDKIKNLNKELEDRVIERTTQLQKANDDLRTAKSELDLFLYRTSHNLMGPIARYEGLNNLMMLPDDIVDKNLLQEKIRANSDEMKKMITKLTDISSINEGIDYSRINLNKTVRNVLANIIIDKKTKVDLNIPEDLEVYSVEKFISLIFSNLVENSVKFKLNPTDIPSIKIEAKTDGEKLLINYRDDGIGIEEEFLEKVFTMFFQATDGYKGNGLGLYLVKKCINAISGSIKIKSKITEYTEFHIVIPVRLENL